MDRAHRVRHRRDFRRVREQGRRLAHPLLRVQWAPNDLAVTRFAFVVGKRVAAPAHERNRLRRRLRELARAELRYLAGGFDIVLIAQPAARAVGYPELRAAIQSLLQRARLPPSAPPTSGPSP